MPDHRQPFAKSFRKPQHQHPKLKTSQSALQDPSTLNSFVSSASVCDSRAVLESLLGRDVATSSSDGPEVPGLATALCVRACLQVWPSVASRRQEVQVSTHGAEPADCPYGQCKVPVVTAPPPTIRRCGSSHRLQIKHNR